MNNLQGLRRGVIATAGAVFASLFFCLLVSPEWLTGWGTVILVAMVPAQMVISLVWQSTYPKALSKLPQPLRGIAFTALNALVGTAVACIAWQTVGGGMALPTPFLIMFLIFSVAVMLVLVVPLQCWPFAPAIRHPGLMGGALLVGAYALAYGLFRWLFDFGFLAEAPFYRSELDPHGLFMAWTPLVFAIAMLVPVLALILFDFWPMSAFASKLPALGKQPVFGILSLLLVFTLAGAFWAGFVGQGMDKVLFMVRVCVAINFGYFILLAMFEGVPALKLPQPWRGLILNGVAAGLAVAMLHLYEAVALSRFALSSGGPTYPLELWLASAMLAVTFPLMVVVGSYFQFWPLAQTVVDNAPSDGTEG
ncbi:MAG: hypothetical protein H6R13_2915 [Proteobacteria bacterium]|nr:hypothetical protein [Pseudomonadota bacterium]